MKKNKLPGDNISLKTKKTEDPLVMAWLNAQTNLMDSIRYLIENEIRQNGVRNLQTYIPVERTGLQVDPNLRGAGELLAAAAEAGAGAGVGSGPGPWSGPGPAALLGMGVGSRAGTEIRAGSGAGTEGAPLASAPTASSEPAVEEVDEEDIEAWS